MKRGVHFLCCAAFGVSVLAVACSSDSNGNGNDGGAGGAHGGSAGAGGRSSGGSGNVMSGGAGTATSGGSTGRAGAGGSTGGGSSGTAGAGGSTGGGSSGTAGAGGSTGGAAGAAGHAGAGTDAGTDASLPDATTIDGSDGQSATDAPLVPRKILFEVKTNGVLVQDAFTHYYGTVSHVDPGKGGVCATTRCQVNGPNLDQACMNCYSADPLPAPTCVLDTCTFVIDYANDGFTVTVQPPGDTYRVVDPTIGTPPQQGHICDFASDPTLGAIYFCNDVALWDPTVLTLIFSQN